MPLMELPDADRTQAARCTFCRSPLPLWTRLAHWQWSG
jgi:hypothetical protein